MNNGKYLAVQGRWLCLLIATLFFSSYFSSVRAEEDAAQQVATPVSSTTLDKILFFPSREAPATVVSLNNSMISAEISGEILEILVQTGDEVKKDEVLAKIDCEPYQIAKQRANAALNSGYARSKYAKQRQKDAEKLRNSRAISADQLNMRSSEANALASEIGVLAADLKEAKRRITKCIITAPFDAVVVERQASVGDYTSPGSVLVKLLDLNNLEVSAKIQQQDVDSLKIAGTISFIASGKTYPVTNRTVVPLVDSRIRSYEARLDFTKDVASTGSAGRLRWESDQVHIPADYLVKRNEQLGIFINKDGTASFHLLDAVGNGLPAAIDLPENTEVITTGRYGLVDGQAIKIVNPQ
ncbi:MAG: efflux RND transporter periplasmic adaptor subunit [Methylophaga sp.]|nr:efflux RND transporter periplasmic adaptor subunit [Methylophaga sp.]